MNIGSHISAAGDLALAPERAAAEGCECFQFFSRPPQGGPAKPISPELAQRFQDACTAHGQQTSYIHAPYYINLASANPRVYHGSIEVVRQELERGSQLGVKALMIHTGSAKELGEEAGLAKAIEGIAEIMKGYKGTTRFLLEIAAGAGAIIGDRFEEIALLLDHKLTKKYDIGVCFDTAHAFASGYDLRTPAGVADTFKQFEKIIGRERLTVIHANDSKVELGARKDRHDHIGQGHIGEAGFASIVAYAQKHAIDMVTETPKDGTEQADIKLLQKLRDRKKKS